MPYEEMYDFLEGFESNGEWPRYIFECDNSQIEQLVDTLFELTKQSFYSKPSFFNFYANKELAGGNGRCDCPECRIENVKSLARFTALYGDYVLVPSPIDYLYNQLKLGNQIDRQELVFCIIILLELKPLVLAKLMGFISEYIPLCESCIKSVTKTEQELRETFEQIYSFFEKDIAISAKVHLSRDKSNFAYYSIYGLEKYGFNDPQDIILLEEPKFINKLLAENNNELLLDYKTICELEVPAMILEPIINDIFQAQIITKMIDSSYLTTRRCDMEIIEHLHQQSNKKRLSKRKQIICNSLFHELPIITEASLDSIVKLRQKDGESFQVYRDEMNRILKHCDTLKPDEVTEMYRDIILPEINKMNRTILLHKQDLKKSIRKDVFISSAAILIGSFANVLPLDYPSVLGLLGGVPAIAKTISDIQSLGSDSSIKNNSFYFLWKLGKQQNLL